jgi:hypothetical protein
MLTCGSCFVNASCLGLTYTGLGTVHAIARYITTSVVHRELRRPPGETTLKDGFKKEFIENNTQSLRTCTTLIKLRLAPQHRT